MIYYVKFSRHFVLESKGVGEGLRSFKFSLILLRLTVLF